MFGVDGGDWGGIGERKPSRKNENLTEVTSHQRSPEFTSASTCIVLSQPDSW